MPANTPNGLPYPLGTDPISQGDDAILALATALDKRIPAKFAGGTGIAIPAVANGAAVNINIVYPVGLFTVTPILLLSLGANRVAPAVTANSTAGATVNLANFTGAGLGAGSTMQWIAIQLPV